MRNDSRQPALGVVICTTLAALGWTSLAFCAAPPPFARDVGAGDAQIGRARVQALACTSCHRVPGLPGPQGNVGPSLAGVGARALIAGTLPNRPAILVRFVHDAPSLVPGTAMPPMPIDVAAARDIAAFLATLR